MFKPEFQKTIAKLRKEYRNREYPKAMLTGQQWDKRTATVNCGGEASSLTKERCMDVLNHPEFQALIKKHNATAYMERKSGPYGDYFQVRINGYAE